MISLEAIIFNHDPTSQSGDALNVRKNETTPIVGPEWQLGVHSNFEDSVAAYSIKDTEGHDLTIKAKFVTDDLQYQEIWIRAVAVSNGAANNTVGVLGNVEAKSIALTAGASRLEEFELQDVGLQDGNVGVHDISWQWQYRRTAKDEWTDFQITRHRIYAVLDTPQLPWQQKPFIASNTQVPWTDVLEHACRWAAGAKDEDEAAAQITGHVYELGPDLIRYDSSSFYVTWVFGYFNCTRFLERLAGETGNGSHVNCTDCAAIVTTFANAVGCSLSESTMSEFDSNPILRIGEGDWFSGTVGFHEVAWKGLCGEDDLIFDACYNLDGDDDPSAPPHDPLIAANIRFGKHSDLTYRFRLMSSSTTRLGGMPQPQDRQRRPISSSDAMTQNVFHNPLLVKAAENRHSSLPSFTISHEVSATAHLGRLERLEGLTLQHSDSADKHDLHLIEHTFDSNVDSQQTLVRIDQYECASMQTVREVLLQILAGFQVPILRPTNDVGDFAFKDEQGFLVIFARRNLIFTLRNAGNYPKNLSALASVLDHNIQSHV